MTTPSQDSHETPSPVQVLLPAALSLRSAKSSPQGAKLPTCPARLQLEKGQASPEAALPLQAIQGLAPHRKANA